jgi:hypothetical protein
MFHLVDGGYSGCFRQGRMPATTPAKASDAIWMFTAPFNGSIAERACHGGGYASYYANSSAELPRPSGPGRSPGLDHPGRQRGDPPCPWQPAVREDQRKRLQPQRARTTSGAPPTSSATPTRLSTATGTILAVWTARCRHRPLVAAHDPPTTREAPSMHAPRPARRRRLHLPVAVTDAAYPASSNRRIRYSPPGSSSASETASRATSLAMASRGSSRARRRRSP